jgi:tetratricopeptide (TPR) repeat protein
MKTTVALLICLAALLGTSPATGDIISATLKFTRTQDMLAEADRSAETGDHGRALLLYKLALSSYTEIMTETPDFSPDMIEFRMEYCDDQLQALLDSIQPDVENPAVQSGTNATPVEVQQPSDVPSLLALAREYLEEGESEAARARIIEGFKVDPDNVNLRLLAGLAQCQARRFGDAIFLLKELSIEEPSNAPVHVGLAAAYFGDGQREAAIAELETAISVEPGLAEAYYNMAQLMLTGPEPDREAAHGFYQRALELGTAPDSRLEAILEGGEE